MSIAENVAAIQGRIARAALACGRNPAEIQLCAATKMNDADAVRQAIAAGVSCCGENRVQELTAKAAQNAYEGAPVHFIGHLQTNKVRQVVGRVDLIQSVDSLRLLEVNIANEESKSGFDAGEVLPLLEEIGKYPNICVRGLMAIPPISRFCGENQKYFQKMFQLYVDIRGKINDNVKVDCLSMGMSDDFEDAIAAGSTMVRVGTAIFGARHYA